MLETFRNWINILLGLGIFVTILQLVMPKNKLNKYIYSLIGVITIITIVSPMIDILKNGNMNDSLKEVISNIDTNDIKDFDSEKYLNVNQDAVKESFVSSLKMDIKNKLMQNNIQIVKSEVFVDSDYNIEKIEINIRKINEENSKISSVTQVVKYINEQYDVDFSKIVVIEEAE